MRFLKYYCEFCGKLFDSEDKCLKCENGHRKPLKADEKYRRTSFVTKLKSINNFDASIYRRLF